MRPWTSSPHMRMSHTGPYTHTPTERIKCKDEKQLKVAKKRVHGAKQQPAETAAPKQTAAPASEPLPPQLSRRQQRSAQRLLEFQEKKRAQLGQNRCGPLDP